MNCDFGLTCCIYVCRVRSESTPDVFPKARRRESTGFFFLATQTIPRRGKCRPFSGNAAAFHTK